MHSQPSPLARTPGDLLIEIAHCLDSRSDILHLSLASSYVFSHISSVLYESVTLNTSQQCHFTLGMLAAHSNIARHVRELTLRLQPSHHSASDDGNAACTAVIRVASSKTLDALCRFVWDADELPLHEDMWFALRIGCPQLRYVGTSIGCTLPRLNSHLFDFCNLSGFALHLRPGFYEYHVDLFMDEDQPISRKFWDMLIHRCPNLEELSIEGASAIPADIHALVQGYWPRLKKLSLGDICIDWIPRPLTPGEKRPFVAFLEAHKELKVIKLSRHNIQPIHFASLDPTCLPSVTSFSGTHQQLQALPHLHHSLKQVTFRDPVETREVSAPTIASILRELTSLTDLRISFALHSMYDSGNLLRSLIQSCPNLRHLDLTCAHKPSFQLDAFAKTIRGFPKLRTLHLTIVKYPGDETLASGAVRIAQSNPRLQKFSVTFIPPLFPAPFPYAWAPDAPLGNEGTPTYLGAGFGSVGSILVPIQPFSISFSFLPLPKYVCIQGLFTLITDAHGLPLTLQATETSRVIWPWRLGETVRSKKYETELGPFGRRRGGRGGFGRGVGGFRGLVSLMFERSSAGEEVRMILFCTALLLLAAWGFAVGGRRGIGTGFHSGANIGIVGLGLGLELAS
ncbi:hypothetical protein AGABI1DRAFT_109723 [Agaricus bisporus var. burnettii JB137-S8]|uniref:F-box domain-containing protein n=1 Tax=Agaricus bisporus var. burnettii (strain JB137-S8 / ATCC MYA-4627 / FGSC 10392) TaxID=597362 RepID=K5XK98_AGABU|nr:hypothetical protein AGABI2DRAFT_123224 [Agaricus bisporus var. bisporus H97]XP_007334405.1 uncharacterized protein AGABI1DRAFT_109723 [Agaricus bisporus var. burnettii JB137-S8]EKM74935.1 hypothetical protein AGABI1DRAFT_109723 [Agaricus bisporus var. burnettii JB137-S8]EKV42104.1 hypothetical protein AGABI2DRAFT_123224 [Agaricus bisporus var. bisporus H97]